MQRTTKKKIAPVIITVLVILYIAPLVIVLLLALANMLHSGDSAYSVLPILPILLWLFAGGAVIAGVIKALLQRLDEIDGGEEEEARRY